MQLAVIGLSLKESWEGAKFVFAISLKSSFNSQPIQAHPHPGAKRYKQQIPIRTTLNICKDKFSWPSSFPFPWSLPFPKDPLCCVYFVSDYLSTFLRRPWMWKFLGDGWRIGEVFIEHRRASLFFAAAFMSANESLNTGRRQLFARCLITC